MSQQENCFTHFKHAITSYSLPRQFTFPFHYQPHPLCVLAAEQLQNHLETQKQWQHNFGLTGNKKGATGKMFGVLLVQNTANEIGYLSAFSGKLADQNQLQNFVPPVFDMLVENDFFLTGQAKLNQITQQIKKLEKNPQIIELQSLLKTEKESSHQAIKAHRQTMIEGRKERKIQRTAAETTLNTIDLLQLKDKLAAQSIKQKNQLRDLNFYWDTRVQHAEDKLTPLTDKINYLKTQRKDLSATLQQKLFEQYRFLNSAGDEKSLSAIFKETPQIVPPAGAGECAAPKLLQYAFQHGMKPLAIAEFWWGESPKSEVRQHLNFYAACLGKCRPILSHMLEGIKMDENPLLNNPAKETSIEVIYQDDVMLVINKPTNLLSVPGKDINDSVYSRIKQSFPQATGPLTVHRLDMSTSGLLLIALNKEAHKILQKQFINRSIKKRYVALLEGLLTQDEGIIELPLRVDLDDRPKQLVCYQQGKTAKTQWEVIERKNNRTKVFFYPITGRTHQLRVHSAHIEGLSTPIVGDDLYGKRAKRLHLHAEYIEFNHPISKELMSFQVDAEF